jgi:uncharacterized protein
MPRHLMLVPSLACPASCTYCFGPCEGGPPMRRETVEAVVYWQNVLDDSNDPLQITFHGGEPLVPGVEFYRTALSLLRDGLAPRKVRFGIQSNLWLLTDELCELFREYGVSIGTSLDGPEHINDAQRGEGYFRRTMVGIERAHAHGMDVGCICTFTAQSAPHTEEIFDFFAREGLNFTIHASLPSLHYPKVDAWALSPEAHGELLVKMLDLYLANISKVRISTLDALCRSISSRSASICTFGDCLGRYLAVGPDGEIYPCQRFSGLSAYRLGSIYECPTLDDLSLSPVWRMLQERQSRIEEECGDCPYLDFCQGGCPYNTLAANGHSLDRCLRDPYCVSYQRIFGHITDRAIEEVFSTENMEAVVDRVDQKAGLLRRGRLLSLMREGPHPHESAQYARRVLAAVALAATDSPAEALRKFEQLGLVTSLERTGQGLRALHKRLTAPARGLNNLYLHVTFACPLHCTHCYAEAGSNHNGAFPVVDVVHACHEACEVGFHKAVITGGEPLIHPQRDALLDALAELRNEVKPLLTTLRTSLAFEVDKALLQRISRSTDQVIVSIDGDRETHDRRRGTGSYDLAVGNLRTLVEVGLHTELSLASVLPLRLANGPPGDAVRALAGELGIRRTRFRPMLPIGRAADAKADIVPEAVWMYWSQRDLTVYGFSPSASCGIGQNLYVEPDGSAYPCYAWHGEQWLLGPINADGGLPALLASTTFQDLRQHTVNNNRRCRQCPLRYLCGGACRAWNRQPAQEQVDLDAAPVDCSQLHERAYSLLMSAMDYLGISTECWESAGLPLPDAPPEVE